MTALVWILLVCVVGAVSAGPVEAQTPVNGQAAVRRLVEADFEAVRLTKIITAVRITEAIKLDGRLDEPAWRLALPATDFIQHVPTNGMPSGERTEVRV